MTDIRNAFVCVVVACVAYRMTLSICSAIHLTHVAREAAPPYSSSNERVATADSAVMCAICWSRKSWPASCRMGQSYNESHSSTARMFIHSTLQTEWPASINATSSPSTLECYAVKGASNQNIVVFIRLIDSGPLGTRRMTQCSFLCCLASLDGIRTLLVYPD